MWTLTGSRKLLLDVLSGQYGPLAPTGDNPMPSRLSKDDILMVWVQDPRKRASLPNAVFVPRESMRDFIAWVAAVAQAVQPFTAYCRVIPAEDAGDLDNLVEEPTLDRLEDAAVGLIIGESLANASGRAEDLSTIACASSFSFAAARWIATRVRSDYGQLAQRWGRVRSVRTSPRRNVEAEDLEPLIRILVAMREDVQSTSHISTNYDAMMSAVADVALRGDVSEPTWAAITHQNAQLSLLRDVQGASREDRIRAFSEMRNILVHNPGVPPRDSAFLFAYAAHSVSPGTFDHVGLLRDTPGVPPVSMAWLGLLAGLTRRAQVHGAFGGLGRRIIRELTVVERLWERPRGDVALAEFEILGRGGSATAGFRTFNPSYVSVELAPLVITYLRWPLRDEGQPELFARTDRGYFDRERDPWNALGDAIDRVNQLYRTMSQAGTRPRRSLGARRRDKPDE
jgi:hypothetical protein